MLGRRAGQLALQATLVMAMEPESAWLRIRDIAARLGVSPAYLTKILQELSRAGLVRTTRGAGYGVRLARSAREIHPWEVLAAVEPVGLYERCILGVDKCNSAAPCPLHDAWNPIRTQILSLLQSKNLSEFAAEAERKGWPQTKSTSEVKETP